MFSFWRSLKDFGGRRFFRAGVTISGDGASSWTEGGSVTFVADLQYLFVQIIFSVETSLVFSQTA